MEVEEFREFCLSLPGTSEGMKWGEHLTFMVGGKMFAVLSLDELPVGVSFKVSEENFLTFPDREGMIPAPYFAKAKWIKISDIGLIGSNEWKEILIEGYEIVKATLPKKARENL